VAKALHRAPAHHAAVHNAGVIFLVDDHVITLADDGRDRADVGLVAGREDQRGLLVHKAGQPPVKLQVQLQRAVQEAGAGHAGAVAVDGFLGRLAQLGVSGQAQVVVGPDHDHFLALKEGDRSFRVAQRPEIGINPHFHGLLRQREFGGLVENIGRRRRGIGGD